jgi:hypothetical protein
MSELNDNSDYSDLLSHLCIAINSGRSDLACYRQNYLGGHSQALEKTFPFTRQLLTSRAFAAVAKAYIANYPSEHWDINRYGEDFNELLAAQLYSSRADEFDWELISAVAKIEYTLCQLYYSNMDSTLAIALLPFHLSALTVSSADDLCQGLLSYHPYIKIKQEIDFTQALQLHWQGLRIVVDNMANA